MKFLSGFKDFLELIKFYKDITISLLVSPFGIFFVSTIKNVLFLQIISAILFFLLIIAVCIAYKTIQNNDKLKQENKQLITKLEKDAVEHDKNIYTELCSNVKGTFIRRVHQNIWNNTLSRKDEEIMEIFCHKSQDQDFKFSFNILNEKTEKLSELFQKILHFAGDYFDEITEDHPHVKLDYSIYNEEHKDWAIISKNKKELCDKIVKIYDEFRKEIRERLYV